MLNYFSSISLQENIIMSNMKIVAGSLLLASTFAQATWATNHLSLDVAQDGYIRGGRYANNNYQTINPDALVVKTPPMRVMTAGVFCTLIPAKFLQKQRLSL